MASLRPLSEAALSRLYRAARERKPITVRQGHMAQVLAKLIRPEGRRPLSEAPPSKFLKSLAPNPVSAEPDVSGSLGLAQRMFHSTGGLTPAQMQARSLLKARGGLSVVSDATKLPKTGAAVKPKEDRGIDWGRVLGSAANRALTTAAGSGILSAGHDYFLNRNTRGWDGQRALDVGGKGAVAGGLIGGAVGGAAELLSQLLTKRWRKPQAADFVRRVGNLDPVPTN